MSLQTMMKKIPVTAITGRATRMLSSQADEAVTKFQRIMQEYRSENYAQETPYRFRMEVLEAARGNNNNNNNMVQLENLEQVLHNIGAADRLSHGELEVMFQELGDSSQSMPTDLMVKLL